MDFLTSVSSKTDQIYQKLKKFDPYFAEKYRSFVFNPLLRILNSLPSVDTSDVDNSKVSSLDSSKVDLIKIAIKNLVDCL